MNELRVIARCPITFAMRILATLCLAAYPLFEVHKEANLSTLSSMAWLLIALSVLGQVANAILAWFSTTAGKVKEEIKSENGNGSK